ncbi:MAG TPA: peptidase M54, partial [Thermococcus paralvinellae]|nr:peptidase M54 [Thermococcus paralvinellae]
LHELGHAFGLNHCSKNCVMNPPSTIKEWDSRIPDFCSKCLSKLKTNVKRKDKN